MSLKDQLIKKLESRMTALEKEADAKKAEAEKKQAEAETEEASAAIKSELTEKIRSIQSDIATVRTKLDEIKTAGEARMEEFKRQIGDWIG